LILNENTKSETYLLYNLIKEEKKINTITFIIKEEKIKIKIKIITLPFLLFILIKSKNKKRQIT
jgi:hypothetical protein